MHNLTQNPSAHRPIPSSVLRALDVALNARVLTAASDDEMVRWMRFKTDAKRRLAILPDEQIEDAAAAELARLEESD